MEGKAFHSGFICVAGRPNVGKSSLINLLLGQKIAAVSPRPQTTQRVQLGILSDDDSQMIFMDTPGIHKPLSKLGQAMNESAESTISDSDCVLWIIDISGKPNQEDEIAAERIRSSASQDNVVMVLNKADLVNKNQMAENENFYRKLMPEAKRIAVSCKTGTGIPELIEELRSRLPEGPAFYDPDQITDLYERDIAADLIRESLLRNLEDEIPHAIGVQTEEMTYSRKKDLHSIRAIIYVEHDSQKGMIIGKKGAAIKRIGTEAREDLEHILGTRVYLDLSVKVRKNWRRDANQIRRFGYGEGA